MAALARPTLARFEGECHFDWIAAETYQCRLCGFRAKNVRDNELPIHRPCPTIEMAPLLPRNRFCVWLLGFRPGDFLAWLFWLIGLKRLVNWWTVGGGCGGCAARQSRLNDWWRRLLTRRARRAPSPTPPAPPEA